MRFPADAIWKVRSGEQTVVHLPVGLVNPEDETWIADAPAPVRTSEHYALERVVEVRRADPCPNIIEPPAYLGEHGELCRRCKGTDEVNVRYVGVAATLEQEYVEVISVERRRVEDVTEEDALLEGYESREEWFDAFDASHSGADEVWRIEFRYAHDVPNLLAKHGDYTHTDFDAVDDEPEAVSKATLASFAAHNRAKDSLRRLENMAERVDDTAELEEQLADVRRLARERNINIRSTERLIQHKIDEIKKKLRDAA